MSHFASKRRVFQGTLCGERVPSAERNTHEAGCADCQEQMAIMQRQAQPVSSTLPDPTVTGPCRAQATFMCTGEARGEHLNPLAMLPDSTVSADYVPMCQPCKDHLSDAYVKELHS